MKSSYVPPPPPVQCWPWLQKYGVNIGGRLFIRISTTPRAQTETTLTLGGGGGHDHHYKGWAFIYPIPVLLNICFVPFRLCGLDGSHGHYVCEL